MRNEPQTVHATFTVERSFSKPSIEVFRALSEPTKIQKWMGSGENSELTDFRCDFREGGTQFLRYEMGPKSPIPGVVITNEGLFQSIIPGERIITASTMKRDGTIFSSSLVTFELIADGQNTDLIITHQGAFFEGSDGPEMRRHGWNVLADKLAGVITAEEPVKA